MQVKKSICMWCKGRCNVDVYIENERLIKIEEDPEWVSQIYPPIKGCPRRKAAKEYFYHPDRINYPVKRKGERGENKWQRITWNQALDEISKIIGNVTKKYGPEVATVVGGTGRTMSEYGSRFFHLLGSPNYTGQERICFGGRSTVADAIVGFYPGFSIRPITKCVILLGVEPLVSRPRVGKIMLDAIKQGAKLIVVDPRRTKSASMADIWLQLRTGTDSALLLGMINVIIKENLFDYNFIKNWCYGFEEIKKRMEDFPLDKVSKITQIPEEKIVEAARLYATNKPGSIIEGMGIEHSYNSSSILHARWILAGLVGNIDVEGGEEQQGPSEVITSREIELAEKVLIEKWKKVIGAERFRLFSWDAQQILIPNYLKVWKKAPNVWYYQVQSHGPSIYRSIITKKPYPIKIIIANHSNPMITQANTKIVYKALKSPNLKLFVVMDMFMTPSAQLADYVLPAASWLERPDLGVESGLGYTNTVTVTRAVLPNIIKEEYEHYRDYDFWRGLGIRLKQEDFWPWKTAEEAVDFRIKPLGYEFKNCPTIIKGKTEYKKYEKQGFATPTGKVEFYSTILEKLGYDPLPNFLEPNETEIGNPNLTKKYPLSLITGARVIELFHSEWRQIDSIRKIHPYPKVQIHPEAAKKYDIKEGDWVWIETPRGRIKQVASFFEGMQKNVVSVEHGWWLPELPGEEPWLHGVWEVNANVLTNDDPDSCNPVIGTWPLKTSLCKIYKLKKYF